MNARIVLFFAMVPLAVPSSLPAQKSTPDLPSPTKRNSSVETAKRLSRPPAPEKMPEDLPHPFNPEGFDAPVAPPPGSAPKAGPGGPAAPAAPAGPVSDREILETLAARLPNANFVRIGNPPKSFLLMGTNRFEVGTTFSAEYKGQEYQLALTAINTTSFTLRYRNEEFTRPNRINR